MSILFPVIMIALIGICAATLRGEGIWGNCVLLVNIITSALLAINFLEPVTVWVVGFGEWFASMAYYWYFVVLWGLFAVSMIVLRVITDRVSRVKVRFLAIADRVGSIVLSLIIGWVMMGFTLMSLHLAPLAEEFMWGGFEPGERMIFGMAAPDKQWLGFVHRVSTKQFASGDREFPDSDSFIDGRRGVRKELEDYVKASDSTRVSDKNK